MKVWIVEATFTYSVDHSIITISGIFETEESIYDYINEEYPPRYRRDINGNDTLVLSIEVKDLPIIKDVDYF